MISLRRRSKQVAKNVNQEMHFHSNDNALLAEMMKHNNENINRILDSLRESITTVDIKVTEHAKKSANFKTRIIKRIKKIEDDVEEIKAGGK